MDSYTHKPNPEKHSRWMFNALAGVTVGAMVGVGVFLRRQNPGAGRWAAFAADTGILELSKLAKKAMQR
jgi:hypothetical protein